MAVLVPASFDLVTINWQVASTDKVALSGTVTFKPSFTSVAVGANPSTTVVGKAIVGKLTDGVLKNATGAPLQLYVTDDADTPDIAGKWNYLVTFELNDNVVLPTYSLDVPKAAQATGLDLGLALHVDPLPDVAPTYVLLSAFSGLNTRVAALESSGGTPGTGTTPPIDGAANVGSSRTLGPGPFQAAPGTMSNRANQTGVQPASTISDFTEAAQDAVAAMLAGGTGVTLSYNDAGNTLTVTSTGVTDPEIVRDTIGAAIIGLGNITVTLNDAADTITISTTATVNSSDATLLNRSNHTGTQSISTISGLQAALDSKAAVGGGTGGTGASLGDVAAAFQVIRRPLLVDLSTYGADITANFNTLVSGLQPYDQVAFTGGDVVNTGVLHVDIDKVTLDFRRAHVIGTTPLANSLKITGDDVTVADLHKSVDWGSATPARGNGQDLNGTCPIVASGCVNLRLVRPISDGIAPQRRGSPDAGIFLFGVDGFLLESPFVAGSMADGIHVTYGSKHGRITNLAVHGPGDDGLAVVSNDNATTTGGVTVGGMCSDVVAIGGDIVDSNARGESIVGGDQIHYHGINVRRSRASGALIAHEATRLGVTRSSIVGGVIEDANWDTSIDTHAIALINGLAGKTMSDVLVQGIRVDGNEKRTGMRPALKIGQSSATAKFRRVKVSQINLMGGATTPNPNVYVDGVTEAIIAPSTNHQYTLSGAVAATGVTPQAFGYLISDGHTLAEAGAGTTALDFGILVEYLRYGGRYATAA